MTHLTLYKIWWLLYRHLEITHLAEKNDWKLRPIRFYTQNSRSRVTTRSRAKL